MSSAKTPPHQTIDRRSLLIASVTPVIVFFIGYIYFNWQSIVVSCYESGDLAANALQIERAKDLREYLGPYSRFGFNYPGPLLFYIYALGELIFGSLLPAPYAAYNLSQLLLNLFFISYSSYLVTKHTKQLFAPTLLLTAIFMALYPAGANIFQFTWGPAALLTPIIFFLVSSAALLNKDPSPYPIHVLAAALAIQTHIGSAALIVPLEILIVIVLLVKGGRARNFKHLLGGAIIFFLSFVPTIINTVQNWPRSNINNIINFIGRRAGRHTLSEGILFVYSFFEKALPPFLTYYILTIPILLVTIIIFFRKKDRFLYLLALVSCGAIILTILATKRIVGGFKEHVLWFEYSIVALCLFLFFMTGYHLARILITKSYLDRLLNGKISTTIISSALGLYIANHYYRFPSSPLCDETIPKFLTVINPKPDTLYQVEVKTHSRWHIGTGLTLALVRSGIPVCVARQWQFIMGRELVCGVKFKPNEFSDRVKISLFSTKKFKGDLPPNSLVEGKTIMIWEELS